MSSLCYHAEHRAWQERVMRESASSGRFRSFLTQTRSSKRPLSRTLAASNPNMLRDQLFHHAPSKYQAVLQVTNSTDPSTNRSRTQYNLHRGLSSQSRSTYSITYNIPAEVRGKYARPASNVSRVTSETDLKVNEHPLLSRPVTAGSLVRKSFMDAAMQVNLSRPSTSRSHTIIKTHQAAVLPKSGDNSRPMTAAISRPQTAGSRRSIPLKELSHPVPQLPHDVIAKVSDLQLQSQSVPDFTVPPVDQPTEVNPDGGEAEDTVEELEATRPPTATTWKTTSSQRRYIEELEKLLREERKVSAMQRRVLAETQLAEAGVTSS